MRTIIRIGLEVALAAAVAAFGSLPEAAEASVEVRPDVLLYGATAEQIDLGRWAVRRFEAAGLETPDVEVHFQDDVSGCGGNLGFAKGGRIDLCMRLVHAGARRALLHEMGHIWLDENLGPAVRTRFLELRGLSSWNSWDEPWRFRGYEQGAEVLAWALGERTITPAIPDNEPKKLETAYRLLTGDPPPPAMV